jgi:hypothetical protein
MNTIEKKSDTRTYCAEFESPTKGIEYVSDRPSRGYGNGASFSGLRIENAFDWESVKKAMRAIPVNNGLGRAREMAEKLREAIPAPKTVRRTRRFTDYDGEPCLDRYLAGDNRFYSELRRKSRDSSREIALCMNGSESCNVTAEQLTWKSCAFTTMIDLLETAGYSVSAYYYYWVSNTHSEYVNDSMFAFRIKNAGEPLDVAEVLNSTSPWFFRHVVFTLIVKANPSTVTYGLGQPKIGTLKPEFQEYFGGFAPNVQVVDMNKWALSQRSAEESIKQALEEVEKWTGR